MKNNYFPKQKLAEVALDFCLGALSQVLVSGRQTALVSSVAGPSVRLWELRPGWGRSTRREVLGRGAPSDCSVVCVGAGSETWNPDGSSAFGVFLGPCSLTRPVLPFPFLRGSALLPLPVSMRKLC